MKPKTLSARFPRPRIGVDMHTVDGKHQGIRTHVLELFSRAIELGEDFQFVFFLDDPEKLRAHAPFRAANVEIARMPHQSPPVRLLKQLPSLARRYQLDLLHTQLIAPPFSSCPTAITVHDTLFESHPQFFSKLFALRCKVLVRRGARQSSLVCTVSDFSAAEIERYYGVPSEHIITTANGVNLSRFALSLGRSEEFDRLNLAPQSYLLTVGRLEPRKNHLALLNSFANLPQPRPKLVIVGQKDFGFEPIYETIRAKNLQDDVLILNSVTDELLPALYRNALAFVFPSWAEGFGMPLLEAMASGVPVITSSTTALAEVASGAALMINPADPDSITQAMQSVLSQPELRAKLVETGLDRARQYSWDSSAAKLLSSYRKLFGITAHQPDRAPTPSRESSSSGPPDHPIPE